MSTQVQFRRGTTTQNNAFTGAAGEISVDTDLKTIRLHDGTTAGGGSTMLNNISTQTALNKTFSTGSVWQGSAVGLAYGGTGSAITAVAGAVAYSTANGLGLSAAGTSGQILVSGGVNAPTWVPTSSISAGSSTLAATATNIAGGSAGQLIIQADTGLSTFITAGPSGTFLRSAGAGYAPTWATADVTIGSTVISLGSSSTSLDGLNILRATGTSHWTLPVGTTAQRPGTPATGMIRYNTSLSTFEGYAASSWGSLGGVSSVDKFTYIQAETSAGASNGDLDFFAENTAGTAAQQVGQWNRNHLRDYTGTLLGTQTTQNVFNTVATTVNAFGAATTVSIGAATGTLTINNANTVITGNLTVNGTTTTINSTVTSVDDIEFELGSVASPTDVTANGGGIRLKGTTDKTINWSSLGWTSSEDFNLVTGKVYEIAGTEVLSASTVFNSQTTASLAPSATTLTIGATSGTATIRNGTVAITNNATVGGTLGVTGTSTFTGALTANGGVVGNASSATILQTGRTIALTGDVTYTSGSFNGSANVTGTATLANSGVTAGSYTFSNITVDAKGRVTAASSNTVSGSSANTANTLVQRDGSGNSSHGTLTASVFQTSSDLRLKSNIENSSYGLTEVLQLRSVKYIKNNKVEVGLIAQEVEQILPEFVGQSEDGMKTVNYGQMVSVLVKAVQDLQAEVASLKSKLGE